MLGEQLVFVVLILGSVIGVIALRAVFSDQRRKQELKALEAHAQPRHPNPDRSLSRSNAPSLVTHLTGLGGLGGDTTPRQPRLGTICRSDEAFSELAFLDFAVALYRWAHGLRATRDRQALLAWFAEGAVESLFGQGEVRGVSDIRVGAVRTLSVYVDERWASVELEFRAVQTEVLGGTPTEVYRTESWRLRRHSAVRSPPPEQLVALACPLCGSAAPIGPNRVCTECGRLRAGPELAWEVAGVSSTRNPQPPRLSALPLGPSGYPRPRAPEADAQMQALAQRFRRFSWEELHQEAVEALERVLSSANTGTEGPIGRRLRYENALLGRKKQERHLEWEPPAVQEVLSVSEDATHLFIDLRLGLKLRAALTQSSDMLAPEPVEHQVELTLARSKREKQGRWEPVDLRWVEDPDAAQD